VTWSYLGFWAAGGLAGLVSGVFILRARRVLTPAAAFLQLEGETNERITIDGGDLSRAGAPVKYSRGSNERAVKMRT